jgi:hypothetical protein
VLEGQGHRVRAYLAEWNTGVRYPARMAATVAALAARYRLAVVSMTPTTLDQSGPDQSGPDPPRSS